MTTKTRIWRYAIIAGWGRPVLEFLDAVRVGKVTEEQR